MNSKFNYIDLYAGIGGFKYVLDSKGGKCVFSAEIDKNAISVYEYNHTNIDHSANFSMDTFANMSEDEIRSMKQFKGKKIDLISAGFPCQTFSVAGKREGFNSNDTRGTQFFNVINLVKSLKPKVVLLENVKHLVTHDGGKTYKVIRETLEEAGYRIELEKVISPLEVGVPQNRERIFIIAIDESINKNIDQIKINYLKNRNHFENEMNILDKKNKKFEGIEIKQDQKIAVKTWSTFVKKWKKHRDENERSIPSLWLDEMFEQDNPIKDDMPEWKKGMISKMINFRDNHSDWIYDWYSKNKSKLSKRIHAKLEWNAGIEYEPEETIAVIRQSGVRFKKPNFYPALVAIVDIPIIYDKNISEWRNISFNEMVKLQSFDKFDFKKPKDMSYEALYKQLGNSVNTEVVEKVVDTLHGILF